MSSGWSCGLVVLAFVSAGCSSSLGSGNPDLPKEGVTAAVSCANPLDPRPVLPCPGQVWIEPLTALQTVGVLDPVATAAYGTAARWSGWIQGVGIGRDGKVTSSGVSGYTTAWCDGEGELLFDTTGGDCRVRNACDCIADGTCRAGCSDEVALPAVDAGGAILAAYPQSAEADTFDVVLDVVQGAEWRVRQTGAADWIRIDATTGLPR